MYYEISFEHHLYHSGDLMRTQKEACQRLNQCMSCKAEVKKHSNCASNLHWRIRSSLWRKSNRKQIQHVQQVVGISLLCVCRYGHDSSGGRASHAPWPSSAATAAIDVCRVAVLPSCCFILRWRKRSLHTQASGML